MQKIDTTEAFLEVPKTKAPSLLNELQANDAAAAVLPSPPIADQRKTVSWKAMQQRLVRRLNTHEDYLGVHKISALIWLSSLMGIAAVGCSNGFSDIPDSLEVPTWIVLFSSVFQGVTGYDMALKYRASDPIVQKGMINSSFAMLNVAMASVYISPFAPEAFNEFRIGNGLFVMTVFPTFLFGLEEVLKMKEKIKHRNLRNKEPELIKFQVIGDVTSYGFVILAPFVAAVASLVFAVDPTHDRGWILNAAANGTFSSPHYLPENYFALIFFNLSIGVGVLAITLRDKKLISRSMEQTMVAMFTFPAAFLSLHALPF
jgi:hypothetical protein